MINPPTTHQAPPQTSTQQTSHLTHCTSQTCNIQVAKCIKQLPVVAEAVVVPVERAAGAVAVHKVRVFDKFRIES